jgi:hypothetical protein
LYFVFSFVLVVRGKEGLDTLEKTVLKKKSSNEKMDI